MTPADAKAREQDARLAVRDWMVMGHKVDCPKHHHAKPVRWPKCSCGMDEHREKLLDAYCAATNDAWRTRLLAEVQRLRKANPEHAPHCLIMSTSDIALIPRCTCGTESAQNRAEPFNAALAALLAGMGMEET